MSYSFKNICQTPGPKQRHGINHQSQETRDFNAGRDRKKRDAWSYNYSGKFLLDKGYNCAEKQNTTQQDKSQFLVV